MSNNIRTGKNKVTIIGELVAFENVRKGQTKAGKVVKTLAQKMMFTKDVRVDPELNKELWRNGVRNVTRRISVIMERKKNEEDDEAEEKMYTLVKLALCWVLFV